MVLTIGCRMFVGVIPSLDSQPAASFISSQIPAQVHRGIFHASASKQTTTNLVVSVHVGDKGVGRGTADAEVGRRRVDISDDCASVLPQLKTQKGYLTRANEKEKTNRPNQNRWQRGQQIHRAAWRGYLGADVVGTATPDAAKETRGRGDGDCVGAFRVVDLVAVLGGDRTTTTKVGRTRGTTVAHRIAHCSNTGGGGGEAMWHRYRT